jgi:hypothetical protein
VPGTARSAPSIQARESPISPSAQTRTHNAPAAKDQGGTHGDSSPPLRLASILTCRVEDLFSLAQAEEIIEGTSSDDLDTLEATSAPLDDPEWIYKLKFDGC